MTGIGTGMQAMQTVVGGMSKMSSGETSAAAVKTTETSNASDQSLTGADMSAVSSAGNALLQAMGSSDVRMDKVASLQAAIASGSYQVSSSDVADSLMNVMLGKR